MSTIGRPTPVSVYARLILLIRTLLICTIKSDRIGFTRFFRMEHVNPDKILFILSKSLSSPHAPPRKSAPSVPPASPDKSESRPTTHARDPLLSHTP